jgi:hypothetical protein
MNSDKTYILMAVVDLTAIGLAAGTTLLHSNSNQAFAKHAFVGNSAWNVTVKKSTAQLVDLRILMACSFPPTRGWGLDKVTGTLLRHLPGPKIKVVTFMMKKLMEIHMN